MSRRSQLSNGISDGGPKHPYRVLSDGLPPQTRTRVAVDYTRRAQARRHGLTPEELDALGDSCQVCGFTGPLVIDHDHDAAERDGHDIEHGCRRCVRGVLCDYCNTGLAKFQDRPDVLRSAADFVERFLLKRARIEGEEAANA